MTTVHALADLRNGDHEAHTYEGADPYIDNDPALNITQGEEVATYYPHGHHTYTNTT